MQEYTCQIFCLYVPAWAGGEGYMQNEILKIALGAFLGTSWAFLSFPASFLFVVGIFCDIMFCFVEGLPF